MSLPLNPSGIELLGSYYAIIKRDILEALAGAIKKSNAKILKVDFQIGQGSASCIATHIVEFRPLLAVSKARISAWFVCVFFVCSVISYALSYIETSRAMETVETENQQLVVQVEKVRKSLETEEKNQHEISTLRSVLNQGQTVSALLEELSKILPDGTFLTDLSFDAASITVSGYSDTTSSILVAIEASPFFDKAEFSEPILKVPDQTKSRFSVRFELEKRP